MIFVAGQIGLDASGKVVGPSVEEQLQQIYASFDIILADLGLDRTAFLARTVYVTDLEKADAPEVLEAVRRLLCGRRVSVHTPRSEGSGASRPRHRDGRRPGPLDISGFDQRQSSPSTTSIVSK